jgi:hypothetical protein
VTFIPKLSTYCHIFGVYVTNKTGFGFDDRIYWTFVQLATAFYKSLSSTGHSLLLTTLLFQLNCQLLFASRYIASGRTTQKTHPLPTNGYPLLLRIRCGGMCLLSRCLAMGPCFTIHFFIRVPIFMRTSPMSISNTCGVSVFSSLLT